MFDANVNFSASSAAAKRIGGALGYLNNNFPAAFKPFRNRTIVQSIITFVCHLREAGLKAEHDHLLRDFIESFLSDLGRQVELGSKATDPDFTVFQRTVNANVKSGARTRHSVLLRKLFQQTPAFFSALNHSSDLADGVKADVARVAKSIRMLVAQINDSYAAQHGDNLFRPTNKTLLALPALESPVHDLQDYKSFIDNLYFVFREGVGQRLGSNVPGSFADVNDLRTMLDHDVEHGKASKIAAKRKKLANIFAKYAGVPSPDGMDPAAFPLVQVNILSALERDLTSLAKSLP